MPDRLEIRKLKDGNFVTLKSEKYVFDEKHSMDQNGDGKDETLLIFFKKRNDIKRKIIMHHKYGLLWCWEVLNSENIEDSANYRLFGSTIGGFRELYTGCEEVLPPDYSYLVPNFHKAKNILVLDGEKYHFSKEDRFDRNSDNHKETLRKVFIHEGNPNKRIMIYRTRNEIWAWGIFLDYQKRHTPSKLKYLVVNYGGTPGNERLCNTAEPVPLPERFKK